MWHDDLDELARTGNFHTVSCLRNGRLVGTRGASTYLLDEFGRPISLSYHTIEPEDSTFIATHGASRYRLDKFGRVIEVLE
jgi:hypothetical protein